MSSTIEERIVSMKFQGEQFLAGVDKSLAKLDALNSKLKASEGANSLDKVGSAAGRQAGALAKVAEGVQHISDKFKAMGVIGVAALTNVTNQAVFAGERLIKSLTMDPILDGFHEYETNMNSIQTILSNTQAAGTKLSDVTDVLDDLNHYSDQTIYNFSEMAKNIGTFTAAGVGLKPAAMAIKGIANLAALSGSNSEQASGAMYQLSQAISSGRVSLEDWNSVVNAGMGGTVFQRALAQNAEKIGTLSKGAVQLKGDMKNVTIEGKSFRESITAKPGQESWLTSKVLTQTLAQFTGDLTDAQLAAEGFNKEQIKNIQAQAKTAKEAATQVKTLTQLMSTVKESVGSGWSATFKLIFGDFMEAKGLFTDVSNRIGKIVSDSANARNKMLGDWKDAGGRTALIQVVSNSFNALLAVLKPIKDAFKEIFPSKTGKQLADMTKSLAAFTANLKIGGSTANNLKRTFAGVFAVFGIGWDILKQVVGMFGRLLGVAFDGNGSFLEFTATVGDFLVNLREAIQKGKGLENFFKGLGDILAIPLKALHLVGDAFQAVFKNVDGDKAIKAVDEMSKKLEPLGNLGGTIAKGWGKVVGVLDTIMEKFADLGSWVAKHFGGLGEMFANMFEGINFDDITKGLNTGIFAAIALMFKQFLSGGDGGGLLENIGEAIEGLTGALKGMQNALNAAALLAIAAAVGILAVSMNVMAKIDAAGLTRGTAAMGALFIELSAAALLLAKFSTFKGAAKLPLIAGSMILLAAAVAILASAMDKLSGLSWEEIAKGLTAITGLLAGLVAAMNLMPNSGKFLAAGVSMILLAAGIKILASAVTDLSGLSWEDMAKGLTGVGVLIAALVAFANTSKLNVKGIVSGVVVVLMASAIKTLASALKDISALSWEEMSRGLGTTAAGLGLLAGALKALPPSSLLSAAAIFIVASSLSMINEALQSSGGMSWEEIGKGLVVLAGSLAIIAAALYLMEGALPGAAALIVAAASLGAITDVMRASADLSWEEIGKGMTVLAGSLLILSGALFLMEAGLPGAAALIVTAGALAILAPVLVLLGSMSWESIAKGLAALAGVFLVLGVASLVLTPVIPAMFSLALSVAAIGVAMLAAGAGVALFGIGILALATGFAALAVSGVAGATALVGMLAVILGAVPMIVKLVGTLLVALLDLIIQVAPKLMQAGMVIMSKLLDGIQLLAPKIIETILRLLTALVEALGRYVPRMADAALRLMTGFLNALANRIGSVVNAATNLMVAFINAIGKSAPRLVDAGAKMVINFVNGTANAIRANAGAMRSAGLNLATAIIDGMTGGLASGVGRIVSKAKEIASSALNAAKSVLGIHSPSKEFEKLGNFVNDGFRKGLDGNKGQIDTAFKDLATKVSALYKSSAEDIATLTKRLKKLKDARHQDKAAIKETTAALKEAKKEKAEALAAQKYMKSLNDEHSALGKLANRYDAITTKLKAAQQTYADAVKTRDDYKKSITDQFGNALDPTGEMTAGDYITNLKKQLDDTKKFANEIQQLRALGLNDETYKDLLSQGTSAIPFIEDLLKGGKNQIKQVNDLNKQLDTVSGSLGKNASTALYQAAVDSAKGLVDGLAKQQAAIEKQMDKIADAMVKAIKKKLGIKSPSRVFAEVGKFSAQGLTRGLENNAATVATSAAAVGNRAVEALRASMSNVDKMVMGNIDVQPRIRPVLDLTDIQKNAGKIGTILPTNAKMTLETSSTGAAAVAALVQARRDADGGDGESGSGGPLLAYTQIINSPKAVSAVEVYRGTKNQLSSVKGALST